MTPPTAAVELTLHGHHINLPLPHPTWGTESDGVLQGYGAPASVQPGGLIEFRLSSAEPGVLAKIRVLGFGAFDGFKWDEVHSSPELHVPATGVWRRGGGRVDPERWQVVYRLPVGEDRKPGCYLVRGETVDGKASLHHFWVTSSTPTARTVLLSSIATHAARNRWGGVHVHKRARWLPFRLNRRASSVRLYRPYVGSHGSPLLCHELAIRRWARANGVTLDSLTDIEVHKRPELLDEYDHVVIAGDMSYLTRQLVDALRAFRDGGGKISVFGAAPGEFEVDLDLEAATVSLRRQTAKERADWDNVNADLWIADQRWTQKGEPLDLSFLPATSSGAPAGPRLADASRVAGLCLGRLSGSDLDDDDPRLVARTPSRGRGPKRRCDSILVTTENGSTVFVAGTDCWSTALGDFDHDHAIARELDCLTARLLGVDTEPSHRSPLVSVVMTAHNCARTIAQAVDSILAQTYFNLELIVVDDNSEDETFELLLNHARKDRRLRPFKSFRSHGPCWSKNYGMTRARGEFIAFQGSDDLSDADRLFIQVDALRRKPRAVACIADGIRVKENGELLLDRGAKQRRSFSSLMIRTATVLPRIGFFDSVRTSAAREYFRRLRLAFEKDEIIRLGRPLYMAVARGGSLTGSAAGLAGSDGGDRARFSHRSEERKQYVLSYEAWHGRIERGDATPYISFPLRSRPFEIPRELDVEAGRRPLDMRRGALVTGALTASAATRTLDELGRELLAVWHFVNHEGLEELPRTDLAVKTIEAFAPTPGSDGTPFRFTLERLPGDDREASAAHVATHAIVGIVRPGDLGKPVAADEARGRRRLRTAVSDSQFDIILLSDFRFPGGTSQSNAEEIKAQAKLGLSTGLIQVSSPVLKRGHPINPVVQRCVDTGLAAFIPSGAVSRARLLVVRHPTVLRRSRAELPWVEADNLIVIINQAPVDPQTGHALYSLSECQARARECFGSTGTWFPIGPIVRRAVQNQTGLVGLADHDWFNIIDIESWRTTRSSYVADRPVIGRHSRDTADKWPDSREELLSAYPDDPEFRVRILGGAASAEKVLGFLPMAWEVRPFGSMTPREFLAGIDFLVYFHHPRLQEAFGRTILEGMATGAPAILPPHFAALFEDSAIYSDAAGVRQIVRDLYGDRARYEEWSRKGIDLVESRFSYAAHARRLEAAGCKPTESRSHTNNPTGEAVHELPPFRPQQPPLELDDTCIAGALATHPGRRQ